MKSLCHFLMMKLIGVLMKLGVTEYSPADWGLFIDSLKRSLKCVLLHIIMFMDQYRLVILQPLKKNMMQQKVYCSISNIMTTNG